MQHLHLLVYWTCTSWCKCNKEVILHTEPPFKKAIKLCEEKVFCIPYTTFKETQRSSLNWFQQPSKAFVQLSADPKCLYDTTLQAMHLAKIRKRRQIKRYPNAVYIMACLWKNSQTTFDHTPTRVQLNIRLASSSSEDQPRLEVAQLYDYKPTATWNKLAARSRTSTAAGMRTTLIHSHSRLWRGVQSN